MKELSPTATRPARELAVEALTEARSFVSSDYTGCGGKDLSDGALARIDAALSALRAELAAVPQQPDEWLKEATRLADEAVCLGTPHKTNVAYAALLSHLAARPVGALSDERRNAIADRAFEFFYVPPRERQEGLAAYIIQLTEEALAASAPVGALSLSDAQIDTIAAKELDADARTRFGLRCRDFARAILSASAPAASPTRTPQDYAIEHAEYMALGAEQFIEASNALAFAVHTEDEAMVEAMVEACREDESELRGALRNLIYEFRKRRDRALASAPAVPQEAPKMVMLTASEIDEALAPYVFHDRFGIVPAIQRAFAAKNGLEIDRAAAKGRP